MLPATIFRHLHRRRGTHLFAIGSASAINCLNRYAAATGFIKISFLNINEYRNWDVARLRKYADIKKQVLHIRTLKSCDLLQNVIERKRENFIECKNFIVADFIQARTKVKQKVRNKVNEVIVRENILTIPNLLTICRAVLSPYIGYTIMQGDFRFALNLLVVASMTDLMDGQIARRWPKQASKAGSFLDPMADKLLIGSLVISMCYYGLLPLWFAGIVLFRDTFLLSSGFVIRYISLPPPRTLSRYFDCSRVTAQLEPTLISKINTVVQLATIGISLGAPIWNYLDHSSLHGLWYLTSATTFAAAWSYIVRKDTFKIIKSSRTDSNKAK